MLGSFRAWAGSRMVRIVSLTDLLGLITTAATAAGLIFLAIQTRVGNAVAATQTLREALRHNDDALALILERPELWDYFYANKTPTAGSDDEKRALIIAEILADSFDSTIHMTKQLKPFREHEKDWKNAGRALLLTSPVLRSVVSSAGWYPDFGPLAGALPASADKP